MHFSVLVMDKSEDLIKVSKKLDELSIQMLDLMSNYIDIKMTLEDVIKTGSLHLAKSRYIMGNRSVSVLQLPTEEADLTASTRVVSADDDLGFQLEKMTISDSQQSKTIGLKHRPEKKRSEKMNDNTRPSQDPLKWFGLLVPQNMRHAQQNFNRAIELTVECANIQLEMNSVREKFREALLRKKELLES